MSYLPQGSTSESRDVAGKIEDGTGDEEVLLGRLPGAWLSAVVAFSTGKVTGLTEV